MFRSSAAVSRKIAFRYAPRTGGFGLQIHAALAYSRTFRPPSCDAGRSPTHQESLPCSGKNQGPAREASHSPTLAQQAARQRMEQELRFVKGAEDMAGGVSAGAAPEVAFSRHSGICRSDVFITHRKPGPDYRVPARSGPGHKARRKTTRLLIVATSSGRLFLDRVGRHQWNTRHFVWTKR